jgi:hypothetical protein
MATYNKPVLTGLATLLIIVLVFFPVCPITQAQTTTTFTSADKFSIPDLNGAIRFSVNGSSAAAILENGLWSFKDLRLNNSQPLGNLKISAQNSNITILSYRSFSGVFNTSFLSQRISYTVEGKGKQTVNFDFNSSQQSNQGEWSVNLNGKSFVGEGQGWNLMPDNTVVITGATKNATIVHYTFTASFDDSNLPFYQRHSIAIMTAAVVALTVAIGVVLKVKVRR